MGRRSREKGKRGERELAARLTELGLPARRGQQYSGANGDADVVGLPGVHVECKRTERLRLADALDQAERDARPGELPVVMHRRNGRPWLAIQDIEPFFAIYRGYRGGPWVRPRLVIGPRMSVYREVEAARLAASRDEMAFAEHVRLGAHGSRARSVAAMYLDDWCRVYRAWREEVG